MIGSLFKTAALLGLLIALGCEVTDTLSSEPNFGDTYSVVTDDPTAVPRLDTDGLHATVQYSGGCKAHLFDVHFQVVGDTTQIWLQHDANNDACEAYLTVTIQRPVSARALETPNVVLLTPDGAVFPLR